MLSTKLKEAAGNSADATLYVDDVFSTWLYTGNGSTQTITNGIDLAGKGGLVWVKSRSAATDNFLFDTTRGVNVEINSNTTNANATLASSVTTFNSNGFALGSAPGINVSAATYASWTFRKAAKFFDVVTYTGDGTTGQQIPHSLGSVPAMIIYKCTSTTRNWYIYTATLGNDQFLTFNTSAAATSTGWASTPTSSNLILTGSGATNGAGNTYVAYLYAHDTSSTGIIQCGSFTTDGSGNATVNLGWEPQWLMHKSSTGVQNWLLLDQMRGWTNNTSSFDAHLIPNAANAETSSVDWGAPMANGFRSLNLQANATYIYMAIRRPNKPPTTGTQVFIPLVANNATGTVNTVGFPIGWQIQAARTDGMSAQLSDRLRGISSTGTASGVRLFTAQNNADTAGAQGLNFNNTGFSTGAGFASLSMVYWNFNRAPGFFDEVCYTGTGSATTQAHNLTVPPEMILVKERSAANDWWVYTASTGNTKYSVLNLAAGAVTDSTAWNNTTPTASVFSIGTSSNVNASAQTYVAYLFATLAGISKIGSYTGNGTGQSIDCGFGAAGARYLLIKDVSTVSGNWYSFDSARGLTSVSSPYLTLNTTNVETTGNNGVYASSGGFTLDTNASLTVNKLASIFIFLAVA
jgi:hypothetical protein